MMVGGDPVSIAKGYGPLPLTITSMKILPADSSKGKVRAVVGAVAVAAAAPAGSATGAGGWAWAHPSAAMMASGRQRAMRSLLGPSSVRGHALRGCSPPVYCLAMPQDDPRDLARRAAPASGPVEDYQPEDDDPEAPSAADVERFGEVTVK